jgi:two-component system catabolic regulation response regulator CreB
VGVISYHVAAMPPIILIAEDEAEIADTLKYALRSEGMQPIWVAQGNHALEILQNQPVDLMILDVGLPDCNGFELLKEIRKNHHVPVMMLTARSDEVDRIVGLEIGADDYVTKPFSPREVVARIKAILKRSRHLRQDNGRGFEVELSAMRISYCGLVLDLTRSEFLLLATLLGRPGQIFSRRQLINQVWSSQHPSDDRVIDTHVKSLRAKLKRIEPGENPIVTHRGFGYSVEN